MTSDRDNHSQGSKGFSGINSMVSNLNQCGQETRDDSNVQKPVNSNGDGNSVSQQSPNEESRQISQIPRKHGPAKTPWFLWAISIVVVISLIAITQNSSSPSTQTGNSSPSTQTGNSSPSTQTGNRSTTKPSSTESNNRIAVRPIETRPPISENNVHSINELHYCFAEEIRLEGANSSINPYNEAEIDLYNAMVDEYNSRCASFRYYRTDFERARIAIEKFRVQIYNEGKNRF